MKAKFPAFEGIDGAGKTTIARAVVDLLIQKGISVFFNKEPTSGPFGEMIRFLLKDQSFPSSLPLEIEKLAKAVIKQKLEEKKNEDFWVKVIAIIQNLKIAAQKGIDANSFKNLLTPLEEQSLFFADRFFDLQNTILPLLKKGIWVVQDRYELSSGAYLIARGGTIQEFLKLREEALGNFYRQPDLTFFIKTSPEVAIARMEKAGKKLDRNETKDYLQKVAQAYERLIDFLNSHQQNYPVVVINGNRKKDLVLKEVIHHLNEKLLLV